MTSAMNHLTMNVATTATTTTTTTSFNDHGKNLSSTIQQLWTSPPRRRESLVSTAPLMTIMLVALFSSLPGIAAFTPARFSPLVNHARVVTRQYPFATLQPRNPQPSRPFHHDSLCMVPNTKPPANTNRTHVKMVEHNEEEEVSFLADSTFQENNAELLSPADSTAADDDDDKLLNLATTHTPKKASSINYHWTSKNLGLAIPALIGMLADPVLSLIDTVYVGRGLGPIELAALGSCTSIFHLAFNAFRASTTATTSLVATALAHNPDEAKQVTRISLQLGWVLGFVVLCSFLAGGTHALAAMGVHATSPLFPAACDYLFARCWAGPAVLMIVVTEGVFRGYGDTRIPLLASGVAAMINLVFDPICMFNWGWGIKGAAAATAFSQVGAAVVYAIYLRKRNMLPERQQPRTSNNSSNSSSSTGGGTIKLPRSIFSSLSKRLRLRQESKSELQDTASTAPSTVVAATTTVTTLSPSSSSSPPIETTSSSDNTPSLIPSTTPPARKFNSRRIIREILGANLAMFAKQGSLLLAWTYATARATRLGHAHVAAHQVALSFWMMFALILDGAAVSAQVLMGRAHGQEDAVQVNSLIRYMTKFAALQGIVSTAGILLAGSAVPRIFTSDPLIRSHLIHLMPHLAFQQILVSMTLVMESLVIGANEFNFLAIGTAISTIFALRELNQATTVVAIWSRGIVLLFAGRLLTSVLGVARIYATLPPPRRKASSNPKPATAATAASTRPSNP